MSTFTQLEYIPTSSGDLSYDGTGEVASNFNYVWKSFQKTSLEVEANTTTYTFLEVYMPFKTNFTSSPSLNQVGNPGIIIEGVATGWGLGIRRRSVVSFKLVGIFNNFKPSDPAVVGNPNATMFFESVYINEATSNLVPIINISNFSHSYNAPTKVLSVRVDTAAIGAVRSSIRGKYLLL